MKTFFKIIIVVACALMCFPYHLSAAQPIQHDAEHYVLLLQYAAQWAAEDREIDRELRQIRKKNGGKPPNIVYVLLDDMGFGEYGMPALNKIRGGRTPNIDTLAAEGVTFTRMYADPSCLYDREACRPNGNGGN